LNTGVYVYQYVVLTEVTDRYLYKGLEVAVRFAVALGKLGGQ